MEARRVEKIQYAHRTHAHALSDCDGSAIGDDVVVGDGINNGTHVVLRCDFAQCERNEKNGSWKNRLCSAGLICKASQETCPTDKSRQTAKLFLQT